MVIGKKQKKLVSIAIPAYKVTYLQEAIDSALQQDYAHIELIIVNDNSPYNLDEIVKHYSDKRIRYYKNEKNLGKTSIVHNWNKCLSFAKGEFFVLLCDDDILKPNFVSELIKLADKYPSCNVFHARKINLYENGNQIESPIWPEYEDAESFLRNRLAKKRHHTITEFLYRTKYIQQFKYIAFPKGFYSDNASIINFTRKGGIASSSQCLAFFRFSNEHISTIANNDYCFGKTKDAITYWNWIFQFEVAQEYKQQINEEVENTIYNCFKPASIITKIKILMITPYKILSLKHRIGYIINCILRK